MLDISQHKHPGIYRFTNKVNGKIYIGQAQNISIRYKSHRNSNGQGYFQKALRHHGIDSFNFEVLERVDDLSILTEREQYWLDFYRPYEPHIGYNIARVAGSCRGVKRATEQVEAHRLRMTGKLAGPLNPRWGKTHTPEARAIISEARKRAKASPETRAKLSATTTRNNLRRSPELLAKIASAIVKAHAKPIAQIDPITDSTIHIWGSVREINEQLGITICGIQNACRGRYYCNKRKGYFPKDSHGGYKWQYVDLTPLV
ncbi:GIY-YIG nuclease family protein [Fibrella forsythiae]|uniref:GIY-YIG nuclease family protein n=1 Tax=Fibrella forsythiae TaxID=2817061 RepID=A0ABS3JB90_9BACT|nr:GIY-YIG nuclease family protein [Fibrella forsythiae]MBO0947258.1 GIY-YIG nuclease family protein [Fibrella forsythiae]